MYRDSSPRIKQCASVDSCVLSSKRGKCLLRETEPAVPPSSAVGAPSVWTMPLRGAGVWQPLHPMSPGPAPQQGVRGETEATSDGIERLGLCAL